MEYNILTEIYNCIESIIDSGYKCSISDDIGLCILFANKYKSNGIDRDYSIFKNALNRLVNVNEITESNIISGSSGVLWLLKYLKKIEVLDFSNSKIKNLEEHTVKQFISSLSVNNWDYYSGAIGHVIALDNSSCYKDFLGYLKKNIMRISAIPSQPFR